MATIGEVLANADIGYSRYHFNSVLEDNNYSYIGNVFYGMDAYGLYTLCGDYGSVVYLKFKNSTKFRLLVGLPHPNNAKTLYSSNMVVEIDGVVKCNFDLTSQSNTAVVNDYLILDESGLSLESHTVKIYSNDKQTLNEQSRISIQAIDIDESGVFGYDRNLSHMFDGCTSLTQDYIVPSNTENTMGMFQNCTAITHIHSNWNNTYDNEITSTDCYSGCTAISNIDGVNLTLNEYTSGLDEVPSAWGGYGFSKATTSIFKVVIPTDNYEVSHEITSLTTNYFGVLDDFPDKFGFVHWGDGVIDELDTRVIGVKHYHVYAKAGTYVVKMKRIAPFFANNKTLMPIVTNIIQLHDNYTLSVNSIREYTLLEEVNISNCLLKNPMYTFLGNTKMKKVIANNVTCIGDFASIFNGCSLLTTIEGIENWNTSSVTTMHNMFNGCTSLTAPPIKNIPDSVTAIDYMYRGCTGITEIDGMTFGRGISTLDNWAPPNLTTIQNINTNAKVGIFFGCTKLRVAKNININISGYNLFRQCTSLNTVENINVKESVDDLSYMFFNCQSLISPPIKNIPNSVISIEKMYSGCTKITDISGMTFGSGITTATDWYPPNLITVDNCTINNSKVNFKGHPTLTTVSNLKLGSNCTDLVELARDCKKLESFSFSNEKNDSNVASFFRWFYGCPSLKNISFGQTTFKKVNSLYECFTQTLIEKLVLPELSDTLSLYRAFAYSRELKEIEFYPKAITITDIGSGYQIFMGCINLAKIKNLKIKDTIGANISNATESEGGIMGTYLENITDLTGCEILSNNAVKFFKNTSISKAIGLEIGVHVTDLTDMFYGSKLKEDIIIPSHITNCSNMFKNCTALTHIHSNWNDTIAYKVDSDAIENKEYIYIGNASSVEIKYKHLLYPTVQGFDKNLNYIGAYQFNNNTWEGDVYKNPIDGGVVSNISNVEYIKLLDNNSISEAKIIISDRNMSDVTATDCYSGCTGITHIDGNNVIAYEGDLGIDCVPSQWGGSGFTEENTTIFQVDITTDNYELKMGTYLLPTDCVINWGDGTATIGTNIHTYSKLGLYTIKIKNLSVTCDEPNTLREVLYKIVKVSNGFFISSNAFRRCTQLVEANISKSDIFGLQYSFYDCTKLQKVIINNPNFDRDAGMVCCFGNCSSLVSVEGVESWGVFGSSMSKMFQNCTSLTTPPIKNIPDSVTDISYMYSGCTNITEIDGMTFGRGIITMGGMFNGCIGLTSLDLSSWNTSAVTDMSYMFNGCSGLTSLDLSNWNTSACTNFSNMFNGCIGLTSLNLSSFDVKTTATVTYMFGSVPTTTIITITERFLKTETDCGFSGKFKWIIFGEFAKYTFDSSTDCLPSECTINGGYSYKDIEVVDTTVTRVLYATDGVSKPTSLKFKNQLSLLSIISMDASELLSVDSMFYLCRRLTSINLSSFNTSNITDMSYMFYENYALTSLDLSNFDTSNVTTMEHMFSSCKGLTSLDLSNFDTSSLINANRMFFYCINLASLDLSNFDTSNVTSMTQMFRYCRNLTSLDLSSFNTSNVINMDSMFGSCENLTSLDVSNFNTSSATNISYMFASCPKITSLDLSNFDTSNVTTMECMFDSCTSLETLDLTSFTVYETTNVTSMFKNVPSNATIKVTSNLFLKTEKQCSFTGTFTKIVTQSYIDGLPNTNEPQVLNLGDANLTYEQIVQLTEKGYTIA